MFNSLTGIITGKFPQKLYIDTHGIEWDVNVPDSALEKLPPVGEVGKVYLWMQHTDALMLLYGFASEKDRSLFFDLLKVDGIGPKGALKILGSITTPNLVRILDEGNLAALQKVPGVGKKTAAKMLLQLKGKLSLEDTNGKGSVPGTKPARYADVITGLVGMGYERKQVAQMIESIAQTMESDEAFAKMTDSAREDTIFRRAIVELAQ